MLLGAAGQIGQALQRQPLPPDWQLGLYNRADLDLTLHSSVRDAVQRFKPDLIINAAAMTGIERAERDPNAALAINFEAPANLAAQCSTHDIPLIQLSTAAVFDGYQNTPYKPDDPMNPLNVYGETKMLGEEAVRHELPWHVILRLSWVFSAFGDNLLTRALRQIDAQDELLVPANHVGAPLPATAVAQALIVIARALLNGKSGGFGTFHLCGTPPCTLFDFAQAVMEIYAPFTSRRPAIRPVVDVDFIPSEPTQPGYAVLDCAKIRSVYSIEQPLWRDSLVEAIQTFVS